MTHASFSSTTEAHSGFPGSGSSMGDADRAHPLPSGAVPPTPAETLAQRFDWLIDAMPVERTLLDRSLVRAVRRLDPDGHLILRRIRVAGGATFDLLALPDGFLDRPAHRDALRALRSRRHRLGCPLRLIREAVVSREPRLSNARLIHESAGFHPSRCATRRLIRHLFAEGGSATLRDCLPPLRGETDPACAILALVASKFLAVDLDHPLGPESRVHLVTRHVPAA
ncbi:hypothetical protein [Methylobacterium sp. Leaf87]|uniref:hypothetical protein n=1 Tax=Methylobacterium sp. Leaf87 TaxID=1736243 RepID=UPI000AB4B2A5|nr:hypothetical protein [Methylobacterium sp. Leaf87]